MFFTRHEAKIAGAKHYYTGKSCKYGHFAKRQVSDGGCCECAKYKARKYRKNHPDKIKEYNRKYFSSPDGIQYIKEYLKSNREKYRERLKKWRRDNPGLHVSQCARFRARRRQAMPLWADSKEIDYIYSLAKEKGQEVDHIVPIHSNIVCGLHTPDNLRVIPRKLNAIKGNRYWPNMADKVTDAVNPVILAAYANIIPVERETD